MTDPPSDSPLLIRLEKVPTKDDEAQQEVRAYNEQKQESELSTDKRREEHRRTEKLRDLFSSCVLILVSVVFFLVGLALMLASWHYLASPSWHWMDEGKLNTVSTMLFSGTLFAFLGLYVRDRI